MRYGGQYLTCVISNDCFITVDIIGVVPLQLYIVCSYSE